MMTIQPFFQIYSNMLFYIYNDNTKITKILATSKNSH